MTRRRTTPKPVLAGTPSTRRLSKKQRAPKPRADLPAATRAIDDFLRALGFNPDRDPALVDTARNVAQAFTGDLCAGYALDPIALLREHAIAVDAPPSDAIAVHGVAITTTCPHHLMPASGLATIAFAPRKRIVGIGALGGALEALAWRLSLQEEIGDALVHAIDDALAPEWAGCRLVMTHTCMTARGARRHGARVETVAVVGAYDRSVVYRVLGVGEGDSR